MNTRRWLMALLVGMALLASVRPSIADDSAVANNNVQQATRPLVTLTGTDSQIKERSYYRIVSEKEWIKIWQRHKGVEASDGYDLFYNSLGLPDINFGKCMVIAVFQGSGWNDAGLRVISVREEKDRIRLRFVSKYYQTAGPGGGGERACVYGFFVLPRSAKAVVVEEEQRSLDPRDPPSWTERATFPEIRARSELLSQPLPPELVLPDAPKTAREVKAFSSLRRDMTMADVIRKCGLPDKDVGSGIHIFVYRLQDGSTVRVGTPNLKFLIYVRHVDESGKTKSLLPESGTR